MSKIRVLHIIKSLGRGGAEMLLPETLRYHDQSGFDFHYIYFLPWKNQMVESIQQQGGRVTCFAASNNLMLMTRINSVAAYVKQHNIQVIHAHLPWAGILARAVGMMTKIPVIYTEHNKQERYHFGTRWFNIHTFKYANTIVAVSADVAESIKRNKAGIQVPIRTILNGVNTERFDREIINGTDVRKRLGIPTDATVIGTVAVFRFQKRLDLWMEIASEILRKNAGVHFIIVGDGPLKKSLEEKREALGLVNRIHLPGLEVEVRPYLKSFDIYMMTSIFEGLPVALLEAMSMGCAVISTDAGGVKEVIRPEVDGLLTSVDTPMNLVEQADLLIGDPVIRKGYSKRARIRVLDAFDMRNMVTALERLYTETV